MCVEHRHHQAQFNKIKKTNYICVSVMENEKKDTSKGSFEMFWTVNLWTAFSPLNKDRNTTHHKSTKLNAWDEHE